MSMRGILDYFTKKLGGRTNTQEVAQKDDEIREKGRKLNNELTRLEALGVEVTVKGRIRDYNSPRDNQSRRDSLDDNR